MSLSCPECECQKNCQCPTPLSTSLKIESKNSKLKEVGGSTEECLSTIWKK